MEREKSTDWLEARTETESGGGEEVGLRGGESLVSTLSSPISRYVLLDPVGSGGMGVVHAAWDRKLGRKIALKLVRTDRGRPRDQDRLLREAQAMAALRHDNVVLVYDVGILGEQVFLAMEFVEGSSLRAWLAERPRTWREVVRVFLAAGRGLQAAHQAGLVHRDFKPDNVLMGRDGVVRVADFGLAREMDPVEGADGSGPASESIAQPWHTDDFMGTLPYMAPELLQAGRADARSDQYAFAAALYEALHGRRPFEGANADELRAAIDRPLPPSPGVPRWLRDIVARGLARLPGDRYPSLEALLADLARNPDAAWRRRMFWGGGAVLAAALAVGAVHLGGRARLLCAGPERKLVGVWDPAVRARVEAAFAATKLPFAAQTARKVAATFDGYGATLVASTRDACEATQIRGEQSARVMDLRTTCVAQRLGELRALAGVFTRADRQTVINAVKAASGLTDARTCDDLEALARPLALPADPGVRAQIAEVRDKLAQGNALWNTGKLQDSLRIIEEANRAAVRIGYRPATAETLLDLAILRTGTGTGSEKDAEPIYRQAVLEAEQSGHDDVKGRAAARLAHIVGLQGRDAEARMWGELALAVADRIRSPIMSSRAEHVLAMAAERGQNYEEAERRNRRALELLAQALGGPDRGAAANVLQSLSYVLRGQGRLEEGGRLVDRALAIAERDLGSQHPVALGLRADRATVLLVRGDARSAAVGFRRVVQEGEEMYGPSYAHVARWRNQLAMTLLWMQDFPAALIEAERALGVLVAARGPRHEYVSEVRMVLARALIHAGRLVEARTQVQQGLLRPNENPPVDLASALYAWNTVAQLELATHRPRQAAAALARLQALFDGHPDIRSNYHDLLEAEVLRSEVALQLRQLDRAAQAAERALAQATRTFAPDVVGFVPALVALGQARLAQNRAADAVAPLQRALTLLEHAQIPESERSVVRLPLSRALAAGRQL